LDFGLVSFSVALYVLCKLLSRSISFYSFTIIPI
jgi:hypothetical protein